MWFRKKQPERMPEMTLCEKCSHYFKPGYNQTFRQFPNLCDACGKPHRERAAREEIVVQWARKNWEKLEPRALRDKKKEDEAREMAGKAIFEQQQRVNREYHRYVREASASASPYTPYWWDR